MTIKQFVRHMNRNSERFLENGDIQKSLACMEVAAVLKREHYDITGHVDELFGLKGIST